MERETYRVVEWNIENFSCWNRKIHSRGIESPESQKLLHEHRITLHLFPKGLSGNEERVLVNILFSQFGCFSGELSFVGPDGSLISQQKVHSEKADCVLQLPPGPEFLKIVTQIRKNEELHKDRLTLRLCLKRVSDGYDSVEYMSTTIDAFDAFFKISPHILKPSNLLNSKILWLYYPLDETSGTELMTLVSSRDRIDNSKIELALDPHSLEKKVYVLTRVTVLNREGDVLMIEENEHLFSERGKWTFSSLLTDDQIETEGLSAVVKVKIIPCNPYKNAVGLGSFCSQAVDPDPSNMLRLRHQSVSRELHSNSTADVSSNQPENAFENLSRQMMCLFQEHNFSDIRLRCENSSFPVHRAILGVRSPVFKSMFRASEKVVDITDMTALTLKRFLAFLYTGTIEDMDEDSSLKLYSAAVNYQVPALKKECANLLSENISISNVCDVLSLAVKHEDEKLTSAALKFVLRNYNKVLESRQWKSFMKREPLLVAQTMTLLADKNFNTTKKAK